MTKEEWTKEIRNQASRLSEWTPDTPTKEWESTLRNGLLMGLILNMPQEWILQNMRETTEEFILAIRKERSK